MGLNRVSIHSRARIVSCFFSAGLIYTLLFSVAHGQTTAPEAQAALEQAKRAYAETWAMAPLAFSTATFAKEPAAGYGQYTPRDNAVFKANEPLVVYLEPTGFSYGRDNESHVIALDIKMELRTPDGNVLTSSATPQRVGLSSQSENKEFKASLIYNFAGLQDGEYVLHIILEDANSDKAGAVDLPFTIEGAQDPAR